MICPHTWIPLSPALEECVDCGMLRAITAGVLHVSIGGSKRTPPTPYCHQQDGGIVKPNAAAITARWRELSAEHAARMFADAEARFMAHRAPVPQDGDIIVPSITGQPVLWQPITENESHD